MDGVTATAANLALWKYLKLKTAHGSPALKDELVKEAIVVKPANREREEEEKKEGDGLELDWRTGEVYAEGQSTLIIHVRMCVGLAACWYLSCYREVWVLCSD